MGSHIFALAGGSLFIPLAVAYALSLLIGIAMLLGRNSDQSGPSYRPQE
ncbi:MAG: hypothetical protein KIS79_05930 [Burkholderiales bacterium]|nr:hypothetical protein [Burkholderiales bacterium]MCW5620627.1 hypothetical protein [Burkholderiales bacterium]